MTGASFFSVFCQKTGRLRLSGTVIIHPKRVASCCAMGEMTIWKGLTGLDCPEGLPAKFAGCGEPGFRK